VGDKSTGKCVRDAYILTEKGLQLIDDIGQQFPMGASRWDQVLGLNNKSKSETTHFYKERVRETIKFQTEHGFELCGTAKHKVQVLTEDLDLEMRRLDELQLGDHVVVAPATNVFGKVSFDRNWAGLLGFLVADGTLSSGPLIISNQKQWARGKIFEYSRALGLEWTAYETHIRYLKDAKARVEKYFCKLLDGMTAPHKFVPPGILAASKEVQIEFLRALISCDSDITSSGLQYVTASRRLAREVHMMLLNLGIVATFQESKAKLEHWDSPRTYYNLRLSGKRYDTFFNTVGTLRPVSKDLSIKDTSSYLSIPYIGDRMRSAVTKVRNRTGWSKNGRTSDGRNFPKLGLFCRKDPGMTRDFCEAVLAKLDGWLDEPFVEKCQQLLNSNYVFEKVVDKQLVQGKQIVYDVHVPGHHLFWSSGFISHNTLLAIEACANFAMQHPKGKIYYREVESAFDNDYAEALGMPISRIDFGDDQLDTVEDFFEDMQRVIAKSKGIPSLYVLDSLDALSDRAEMARDIDKGTYGANKPKQLSEMFRRLVRQMQRANVTLIVISQVRSKIGISFGRNTTRSGGRALDFYSSQVLYLQHLGQIAKTIKGIKRPTGIKVRGKIDKNKVALPLREAGFSILFGYGVNDRAACIEWLKQNKSPVPKKLIPKTKLAELHKKVEDRWWEIESSFLPTKRKYAQ